MVSIPNIYKSKHVKYYVLLPILLMILGAYMSSHIVLDSSLSGGVSIVLQTNSSISSQQLSSEIENVLHLHGVSIQKAPGGVQITIPTNESLSNSESYLLDFYTYKNNYTNDILNATNITVALQNSRGNTTLLEQRLSAVNKRTNASMVGMSKSLNNELSSLSTFKINNSYKNGDVVNMSNVANAAYSQASNLYKQNVMGALSKLVGFTSYSYQQLSPTLGKFFLGQLRNVIIIAFIIISIVVFFIFRSPVPAFAVVFGAANDIIIALGAMGLFGIPLGITSIGGLLMLLGYSIDTDVLTSVRILKRHEGTPSDRAYASMRTGLTMTLTALVSFGVLFAISMIEYVPTYYEIAGVVLFGLLGDIITTWLGNASLVLMYKNRKDKI